MNKFEHFGGSHMVREPRTGGLCMVGRSGWWWVGGGACETCNWPMESWIMVIWRYSPWMDRQTDRQN